MTLIPTTDRTQYCFVDCGKEICECKPTKKIQVGKDLTAMQMLIEVMQKDYDSIDGSESYVANVQKSEIGLRILQAKSLFQKEQEQIEKAFDLGVQSGMTKGYQNVGKDYYQSKYGGEDERVV